MPNHVTNQLHIYSDFEAFERDAVSIREHNAKHIDFNILIPAPTGPAYEESSAGKMTQDSWYYWNRENWGTKWNAYDSHISTPNKYAKQVTFRTAWSPPEPWLQALAEKGHEFEIHSFDEGWCYAYIGKAKEGKFKGVETPATPQLYQLVYEESPAELFEEMIEDGEMSLV